MSGISEIPANSGAIFSIMSGPKEQFMPTASTPRLSSIATIVLGSAPVISFPHASYAFVTNTVRSQHSFAAITAAFVSRQSFIVSIKIRSAPHFTPAFIVRENSDTASSNPRSPKGSVSRPVGPMSSAVYTCFSALSAASRAHFIAACTMLSYSGYLSGFMPKVFAVIMSLPASM